MNGEEDEPSRVFGKDRLMELTIKLKLLVVGDQVGLVEEIRALGGDGRGHGHGRGGGGRDILAVMVGRRGGGGVGVLGEKD